MWAGSWNGSVYTGFYTQSVDVVWVGTVTAFEPGHYIWDGSWRTSAGSV